MSVIFENNIEKTLNLTFGLFCSPDLSLMFNNRLKRLQCLQIFEDKYAVGTPAVGDVDGDGGAEIFIPTGQKIHVLKFGES